MMAGRIATAIASGLLAIFVASTASAQQQGELYGAIAYSADTQKIGVSSDNPTQAEAESVALQNCKAESNNAPDCKVVMWVRNACAALAVGQDGGWGTDWGNDRAAAERKALAFCGKYSQTCQVVRRVCAGRQ